MIPFVDTYVLSFWNQVFFRFAHIRSDNNLALTFGVLAKSNHTVNFRYDGEILWFPCLEKFSNPWKTTGDIFGLGRFPGNLGNNITSADNRIFLNRYI